ncbi:MAG: methionine--tRNA ligase [Chlamydiota bacterium]
MKEKVLITSALPYANGPLHFGHIAGAYLPGDCFARFKRLQGCDVLYLCGSDEYGIAITLSAEMAKRTPKEQVDLFHGINKELFHKLEFSFDHYSRTTWEGHDATVQAFFLDLLKNGHIEEKTTHQLYSESEKRFLADRYVQGTCPKCGFNQARGDECQSCGASYEATDLIKPVSKVSGASLILKETKHWFLRFDHFKDDLLKWIEQKNWKSNVSNFALSYIKDLRERAITRDSNWGIPVPLEGAEGKVLYVWFDAPIGYISAAKEWALLQKDPDLWKKYWLDEKTRLVQFIGKDNIPFHSVFFPAMVMGQNTPYKLVDDLPANEFYNLEGRQFSKSDGWTIDLDMFFTSFTADQIRYVIASNAPETGDSEFTWKDFQNRCNSELLGKYGNFVNRVLVFVYERMGEKVPTWKDLQEEDLAFLEKGKKIVSECKTAYDTFQLRKASQLVMELAQAGNVYFDSKKPWKLIKEEKEQQNLQNTMRSCMECIKWLALISNPIIPKASDEIRALLGFTKTFQEMGWDSVVQEDLIEKTSILKPHILFTKIEEEVIQKQITELHKMTQVKERTLTPIKPEISIEDVRKLDLRLGEIKQVERVPKSKKLLKLLVDIGLEKRQVVAGIGEGLEDINSLLGRKIILVANLKPALLMGLESQGMVLACKHIEGLELPSFVESSSGDIVS